MLNIEVDLIFLINLSSRNQLIDLYLRQAHCSLQSMTMCLAGYTPNYAFLAGGHHHSEVHESGFSISQTER